jgi:hypothetical protein
MACFISMQYFALDIKILPKWTLDISVVNFRRIISQLRVTYFAESGAVLVCHRSRRWPGRRTVRVNSSMEGTEGRRPTLSHLGAGSALRCLSYQRCAAKKIETLLGVGKYLEI